MLLDFKERIDLLVERFGNNCLVNDLAADEKLRANMAERWGLVRLTNSITRVRSVFKYGTDNGPIERTFSTAATFAAKPRTPPAAG